MLAVLAVLKILAVVTPLGPPVEMTLVRLVGIPTVVAMPLARLLIPMELLMPVVTPGVVVVLLSAVVGKCLQLRQAYCTDIYTVCPSTCACSDVNVYDGSGALQGSDRVSLMLAGRLL